MRGTLDVLVNISLEKWCIPEQSIVNIEFWPLQIAPPKKTSRESCIKVTIFWGFVHASVSIVLFKYSIIFQVVYLLWSKCLFYMNFNYEENILLFKAFLASRIHFNILGDTTYSVPRSPKIWWLLLIQFLCVPKSDKCCCHKVWYCFYQHGI